MPQFMQPLPTRRDVTISHLSFVVSKLFGKGETKSVTAPSIAHAGCGIHKWSSRGLLPMSWKWFEISLTAQLWECSRKAQERFRELVNLIFLWLWPRLILTVNTGDRFSRDRDGDRGSGSMRATDYHVQCPVCTRAANDPSVLIITEVAPTSASPGWKCLLSLSHLRHYA